VSRGPGKSAGAKGGVKTVNLALQGGGSHGAYGWGVLDALAEDQRIEIGAISGASAGAMNAVVYASALAEGGATAPAPNWSNSGSRFRPKARSRPSSASS
jgi:predicted acylesterase/phospholipase RssA